MDTILQAALIGVLQGLTEFLPISSSAHLILVPWFLGWDDPFLNSAAFDVMLHVGTLVALLAYFRTDLLRLLRAGAASLRDRSLAGDPERWLAWLLVVSVVPAALLGATLESFFDTYFRERQAFIGLLLVAGAAILWLAERHGRRDRGLLQLRFGDALAIGAAQALALFPGISRSGITIAAGLFLGLERPAPPPFSRAPDCGRRPPCPPPAAWWASRSSCSRACSRRRCPASWRWPSCYGTCARTRPASSSSTGSSSRPSSSACS